MKSSTKQSKFCRFVHRVIMGPRAKAFVEAVTCTKGQLILLVICVALGVGCYIMATRTFAPEVRKITIANKTPREFASIDIQAVLNSGKIKKEYGVNQYFNIQLPAAASYDTLAGLCLKPENNNGFRYHSTIEATFSGRNLFPPDYRDSLWHADEDGRDGERRCREIDKSTFVIEQRSQNGVMPESVIFYGNDIFYQSESSNPYIAFYLKLDGFYLSEPTASSGISFYFTKDDDPDSRDHEKDNMDYRHPINVINSYPKASTVSPTGLSYTGDEFQTILKDGLYFIAEDLSAKKVRDRESFWYSLLLGAFLSWAIQLIVSIVKNWKQAFARVEKC